MNFAPASQSYGTVTTSKAPEFTPTDHIQLECAISASNYTTVHESTEDKAEHDMP